MDNKCNDHLEINSFFHNFYSQLYTSESAGNATLFDTFFENLDISTVEPEGAAKLEEQFSIEEIVLAIKSMQCGKSSGPNGFLREFKNIYTSDQLSPLLLSIFKESFPSNSLPSTMIQACISLILKKE